MNKLELISLDDMTAQKQLGEISYRGKDKDFITNPYTIALFRILISLYAITEQFFFNMPYISMYGTYQCKEIALRLCRVVEKYGRPAFRRKRKYADVFFKCLDFSKLILGAGVKFGISKMEERKFWENGAEVISFEYKGNLYEFKKLAIFKVIDIIERQLRIKGEYKKTFTRFPRGYVLAEGTLKYGEWKEMRKLGSTLKKQEIILDLSNGTINWQDGFKETDKPEILFKRSIKTKINPAILKHLYGELRYEALADPKRNMSYLVVRNEKGRTIIFEYYQQWIKGYDIYFEVDIVPASQYELTYGESGINYINCMADNNDRIFNIKLKNDYTKAKNDKSTEFIKFYKKPNVLREYTTVKTFITGISTKEGLELAYISRKPYEVEISEIGKLSESTKILKSKLCKQIVTPLCEGENLPTILAGNKQTYWYYTVSTGHYPNPGVIEKRRIRGKSVTKTAHPVQEWLNYSPLIERKYEGYNPKATKDLDYFKGRKFSNQKLPEILSLISSLNQNEYIVERSITPKEYFKMMGLHDKEADVICSTGIEDDKLYHLAGNSIVVNVLTEVFKSMFISEEHLELIKNEESQQKAA